MSRSLTLLSLAVSICLPVHATGVAPGDAEEPGFLLVVHADNPAESLSRDRVAALFLLAQQTWDGDLAVEPVGQVAGTTAHGAFSREIHGKSSAAVKRDWLEADVAGRRVERLVDDAAVLEWVRSRPGAIGYVSRKAALGTGVKAIAVTPGPDESDAEDEPGEAGPSRVSVVLDASGSMRATLDGRSKIDIAIDAIREILETWDPGIALGLVVYGTLAGGNRGGSCQDIQILVPVDGGTAGAVDAALDGIRAHGSTPMTGAVIAAARDAARPGEEARVVLVSDGQETCAQDPCQLRQVIGETGVALATYVVGFDVLRNTAAQTQLRCLARETGGSFQLAWDARSLRKALRVAVAKAIGRPLETEARPLEAAAPVDRGLDLQLVYVEGGEIAAAGPPPRRTRRREPQNRTLRVDRDFWITDTEITQGDWRRLMGGNPSYFAAGGDDGDQRPVERVSFFDALAFANRLSESEGLAACYRLEYCLGAPGLGCAEGERSCSGSYYCSRVTALYDECDGYRLPTRTEWRYAAQGDRETRYWWGDELSPEDANCASNSRDGEHRTTPVRGLPANPFGLYGMHGNAAEWLLEVPSDTLVYEREADSPASYYRRTREPQHSGSRNREKAAGGSWRSSSSSCYSSGAKALDVDLRSHDLGFRLVRPVGP